MEKVEKFEISLEAFSHVADALNASKKTLRASRCERFNEELSKTLCSHIDLATKETMDRKSRFPEIREHVYKAHLSKAIIEMIDEKSINLLALYGIYFKESGEIQITLRF